MTVFSTPHLLMTTSSLCSLRITTVACVRSLPCTIRSLGPAVGGCRMYPYRSEAEALDDVLRLSRGMTYKSALAGLPHGRRQVRHHRRSEARQESGFVAGLCALSQRSWRALHCRGRLGDRCQRLALHR
jgi:hypothetical protein